MATLKLKDKEDAPAVISVTPEQLSEMIKAAVAAAVESGKPRDLYPPDPTMDLPTGEIPAHLIADRSNLPPPDERTPGCVQPPPKLWGSHLNPSPIAAAAAQARASQIAHQGVLDPATGNPYNQVKTPQATQISPPPSRNFR